MGKNGDLRVRVLPLLEAKAGNGQEAVLSPPETISRAKGVPVGEGEQKRGEGGEETFVLLGILSFLGQEVNWTDRLRESGGVDFSLTRA